MQRGIPVRNLLIAAAVISMTSLAHAAELKIGVIDPLKAIADTEVAKVEMAALEKDTTAERNRHDKLLGEIRACKQKLTTDAAMMSATEQVKMRTECDNKMRDFQNVGQSLQATINERQQALLKDFGPKLQKAVEAIAKEGGYDIMVHREAVPFVKPELDISAKVTAKLNAMK
jgi:outer membrane protein